MKKRIIAGLLSFILLTSNSITALATTNVAGTMTGSSAVEDILTLNEVETAEELQEESISDNDIAPDVSSKVENQPVVEESKKESSSDVSTDTENEPEAGTPSVSENSPAQDTDSVSENNPTVSENTLTVSENSIVTDTEILEELKLLVTEAK